MTLTLYLQSKVIAFKQWLKDISGQTYKEELLAAVREQTDAIQAGNRAVTALVRKELLDLGIILEKAISKHEERSHADMVGAIVRIEDALKALGADLESVSRLTKKDLLDAVNLLERISPTKADPNRGDLFLAAAMTGLMARAGVYGSPEHNPQLLALAKTYADSMCRNGNERGMF